MKKSILTCAIISAILCIFYSCKKDDTSSNGGGNAIFVRNGVLILNEGAFGFGNASVSFFNVNDKSVIEDVFSEVNSLPLGDVAQSITLFNNNLYIVVNNSQKIEVVDRSFFKSQFTINGFTSPRYFLAVNSSKAYVSDWSDNNIKIVNLSSYAISGSIPAGNGPEQMLLANNKVYVANVGGFGNDSTVTVIDANTDNVLLSLQTGLNPNSLQQDKDGKIWTLCRGTIGPDFTGGTTDDIGGMLLRINPVNDSIETVFNFTQFEHPLRLQINNAKDELFYLSGMSDYDGMVYKFGIYDGSLPSAPLINKIFYGLGIDPVNENIHGGYSPAFGQNGYMFRYSTAGVLIDSVKVGIGPNGFLTN
ncbi:MAG: DUF5074 domain-containing protein [Bacteroidia bacterium]